MQRLQGSRRRVLGAMGSFAILAGATAGGRAIRAPSPTKPRGRWTPLLADPDAVTVMGTMLGGQVRVLIDTGSAATVVDAVLARRLGLSPAGSVGVRGDIGSVALTAGGQLDIDVGNVKLTTTRYLVTDLAPIFGGNAAAPGVILGLDALGDIILDIDFPARRLALWPRNVFQPANDADRLAVTKSARGQLSVVVALEGHGPVAAAIDMGSSNPLTVSPALADVMGLLSGRKVSSAATGGVDGISISRTVSVATLQIGPSLLHDVPCEVLAKTDPTLVQAKLGMPVLERFLFALDVTGETLWLRPSQHLLERDHLKLKRILS